MITKSEDFPTGIVPARADDGVSRYVVENLHTT